jgi:hypothetical protein
MRNVQNEIINGMANNWEKGFLIKIAGKEDSIWLSTKAISIFVNSLEIPVEYDRLCEIIDDDNIPAVSNMRSGMDISFGGGNTYISDFAINLLNYDSFNEILENPDFENGMVTVYLFFIHPGISYILLSNAMVINNGIIDSIIYYNSTRIIVKCTGGDYFKHRIIPENKINRNDYPFAPESSIGKTIPMLYGSFLGTDLRLNNYNLAPAYNIDENSREYIFAKHECKSDSIHCYTFVKKNQAISDIISNWVYSNSSLCSTAKLTGDLKCEIILQPKLKGTQMDSEYNNNYKNAVDNCPSTSVNIQSNDNFYLKFDKIVNPGINEIFSENNSFGYLKVCFSFGTVVNGTTGKAAKVKYCLENNFISPNNYDILDTMSNSEDFFLFYFPHNIIYDILEKMEIGITVENGGSVEIKNLFIRFKYFSINN